MYISDEIRQKIQDANDCGKSNDHRAEFRVTMVTPEGAAGVTLRKCSVCVARMMDTRAVRSMGRTLVITAV